MSYRWLIAGFLILAAGAFYTGTFFGGGSSTPTQNQYRLRASGISSAAEETGTILSTDPTDIVIQMPSGSTQIELVSSSTVVTKYSVGTFADLTAGTKLLAMGSTTNSGMLAQSIQILPTKITVR